MAEEPEEIKEEQRVTAARWLEESRSEVAVGQKHRDGAGEDWYGGQQHEGSDKLRPNEKRHFVQGHAGRTHVQDRSNEIDRTQNRRGAREMQREDHHVDGGPGLSDIRQG